LVQLLPVVLLVVMLFPPPIIVALSPVIFWAAVGKVIGSGPTVAAIPNVTNTTIANRIRPVFNVC
jgi:hypothetical protein